eukprot:CAMPEP_0203665988 /NCGR_PEP_ID=MMETSP0090-20130426/3122_1 /ASSEMBLY_ACC=CAM_ASM_001088 /TAXON_ID=426623 /ORGANISM="Chaetoceros affinis, Strain CCMP159" /LENGTH=185 /DNA_ID=CAMNT_0050529747 /DNA_START=165 /DNA_END=722 /DNA_ORIENTATION=-
MSSEDDEIGTSSTTTTTSCGFFRQCDPDPIGSVSKAWSLCLVLIIFFFGVSIYEAISLSDNNASWPLLLATIWTTMVQLAMTIIGTFIIKRFSTPFSVGFLLGLVIFVAQQHLMLSITFWHTQYGDFNTNIAFSSLSFALFAVYTFFGSILHNYREDIMVAPVDAKGLGRRKPAASALNSENIDS